MTKNEKYLLWFSIVLVLYTIVGFRLVPSIIQDQAIKNLDKALTHKSTIEKVTFNPYTLEAKIFGYKLGDKDKPVLSFGEFSLNFGLWPSIDKLSINVQEIKLVDTTIDLIEDENGNYNLASLLKPTKEEKKKEEPKSDSTIDFLVSKLQLINANINFTKKKKDEDYKLALKNINYSLYDFGTHQNILSSNTFNLDINDKSKVEIVGAFRLKPFTMYGKVNIHDLQLAELLDYKKEMFNFTLDRKAALNLNLDYDIETKEKFDLFINTQKLLLSDININHNKQDIFKLASLDVANLYVDLAKQSVFVNTTNINKPQILAINNKSGINFSKLVKTPAVKSDEKKEEVKTKESETKKPWLIDVTDFKINNSRLTYDDRVANLKVSNKNFGIKVGKIKVNDSDINVNKFYINNPALSINDKKAKLDILANSSISVDKIAMKDSKVNINSVLLQSKKVSINDKTNKTKIDIKNGNINVSGLQNSKGNTNINKIKIHKHQIKVSDLKSNNLINTQKLNLTINKLAQNANGIKIQSILLKEPFLNVYNTKEKTNIDVKNINVNVQNIIRNEKLLKVTKVDVNKPNITITLPKKESTKETKKVKEVAKRKKHVKRASSIDIGPVNINNGVLTFQDKNLPLPFKTTITKLNGKISEYNTNQASKTKLSVDGVVDKYGTTNITGIVDPNDIKILTDIQMRFKNISMNNFTPYTSKFIGQELDSGKLSLDLKYNIKRSDLDATNSIIITKIKLGKNVESKDAVSLPLGLAIALMEDSKGVIDLNIPVSGNIDDPKFSVGPIIWKAFTNLITKAITAPFKLLGALFGFDESEIKSVNFDHGQSDITPHQKETLDKVTKILNKRPQLALKLESSYESSKDLKAMKKARFDAMVEKNLPNPLIKDYKAKYLALLESSYSKIKKDLKDVKKSHSKDGKLNTNSYLSFLENKLISNEKVTKVQLEKMAKNRIKNIKTYLTKQNKINSKQVVLTNSVKTKNTNNKTSNIDLKLTNIK